MTFVSTFARLFQSRDDVFAHGFPDKNRPGKYAYATARDREGNNLPLTEDVLNQHFKGERLIGVYPIRQGMVSWFAVDFDAPKRVLEDGSKVLVDDPFSVCWQEACEVHDDLLRHGLFTYLERSRSGLGVHLWGFFAEPLRASDVIPAVKALVGERVSYDRIFPVQEEAEGGKALGNLIALPFYGQGVPEGNSVFLDRQTQAIIDPRVFIESVLTNQPGVVQELAVEGRKHLERQARAKRTGVRAAAGGESLIAGGDAPIGDGRPDVPISGVLKLISQYGCTFMRHAWTHRKSLGQSEWWVALGQLTCFDQGREAAHILSRDYPTYSAEETDTTFDRLLEHPPHGCAYIHEHFPALACKGCPMKAPYHVAEKSILELVQQSSAPMRRADARAQITRIRKRNEGLETPGVAWGIEQLDRFTAFRKSELTVIGASPSIGKTALLVHTALAVAKQGVPALVFSAETAEAGLMDRFIAHEANIDSKALRGERRHPETGLMQPLTDDEWARIEAAVDRINALPLFVNFTDINADQVLRNIERVVLAHGVSFDDFYVTFFDYLQFGAKLNDESNYERVSRLSTEFKSIAKITNNPVVVYSQLVRDAEGTEAPSLTMFKESGRIEQDADVAVIVTGERIQGRTAPRRLTGVKQREGESQFAVDCLLRQDVCRFDPRPGTNASASTERPDLLASPSLFTPAIEPSHD